MRGRPKYKGRLGGSPCQRFQVSAAHRVKLHREDTPDSFFKEKALPLPETPIIENPWLSDIWFSVYRDSLSKVDPLTAARRANTAIEELPAIILDEIQIRHNNQETQPEKKIGFA